MECDYVVLTWRTHTPEEDEQFIHERACLVAQGWRDHIEAPWSQENMPRRLAGGVCIMRRPKDEPRKEEDPGLVEWRRLYRECFGMEPPCCFLLPTPDEPRMWTEAEIEEVAKSTKGSVLNERVMQADLCGRLEGRNAELQEAIDLVVNIARGPDERDCDFLSEIRAIKQYLYPLATKKEESNG